MTPERKDGVRTLAALLVALVLLAGVAVVVDRGVAWSAERGLAGAVALGGSDVSGAEVDIHGFPFLTQLAAGELGHVTAALGAGTFGGYTVSDVRMDARGVEPRVPYRVDEVRVDGLLSRDSLARLLSARLDREVAVEPGESPEALAVSTTVPVLGVEVGVEAQVVPTVLDGGAIGVDVLSFSLAGAAVDADSLPAGLGAALGDVTVPVDLPDGVGLRSVAVEPGGVRLHVEGEQVALSRLRIGG
ncbi:hypothetical protein DNL40_09600 [Xylanimonas oleitrophica]|uniref:DUF2993 domain-containing protein n=1 Tax=Xylanimonas oleitrophica TaxID=2607479 RepID=A0A2W5WQD8_9MICO|nr:DUF2993 domain-containing protein [Xylanimonas oleitrophica]PZR52903.1 hypothetical protein DNL40_09600 [Xylanimonas oleitrophica]